MSFEIIQGDCLEIMKTFPDNHFSAIVTDPPYGLSFMGKGWDYEVPEVSYWKEALRVSKPGSFLISMGGTRTFHRLTCAIEDAGWQIRDCISYFYGTGFPKSHNFGCKCTGDPVSYSHETAKSSSESCLRSLPKTDLSPEINSAYEHREVLFSGMQEQSSQINRAVSVERDETGKEPCLEGRCDIQEKQGQLYRPEVFEMSQRIFSDGEERRVCDGTQTGNGETFGENSSKSGSSSSQGSQHQEQSIRKSRAIPRQSDSQDSGMGTCQKCGGLIGFRGYGTALKPAYEPIIMAMKPCDGTFKQNAEKWGQGGINIDASRIGAADTRQKCSLASLGQNSGWNSHQNKEIIGGSEKGRWPSNVILDEEAGRMLDEQSGNLGISKGGSRGKSNMFGIGGLNEPQGFGDSGGASRFFYCAKASNRERSEGLENFPSKKCGMMEDDNFPIKTGSGNLRNTQRQNTHPTVKPLKLMEYLIKLVMPPKDGLLLDPFAGSGTTILAAKRLGFNAIGIEKEDEYCEIARARLNV